MSADLHSLMAPYALDALDADERARFESHLDQCADCQAELAGFMATAVRLGDIGTHTPPPALRDRLLAEVSRTAQERPVVTALASRRGVVRRTLPRLAVAAAFLVGAVGVGGYVTEHQNAEEASRTTAAIQSVLASDDVTTSNKAYKSGHLKIWSSDSSDAAVIVAKDLPALDKGKVYQVWTVNDDVATSQGTFTGTGEMVMKGVVGSDHVALTVEPKGGSKQPTSAPVSLIPV